MMTGAQQSSQLISQGRQPGEPAARSYKLTAGPVEDLQRPGGLPGTGAGGEGDPGRDGVAPLGVDLQRIAPHTGI